MNEIFIALGLILFTAIVSWRREWGIYLIVLLLPTYQIRFAVFGIPMTFLEGMILILAAATLLPLPRRERAGVRVKLLSLPNLFILLFLLAAFLSVFTAPNLLKAAGIFKAYFFEAILFYFLVLLIIDTPQKLQGIFRSLTLLVLYLSVFGIYQFLTLSNLPFSWWAVNIAGRRITSLLNHPNALALLLGPILAMLIFLPKKSKLDFAALALGIIALYLSFSRAAWLALVVTLIGFGLLSYNSPPPASPCEAWRAGSPPLRLRGGRGALLLLVIVIVIILAIPFSRLKLLELANRTDPSQQNRYVLWSAASDILKKSPLFGVGLMGFHEKYKNYPLGPDRVVQNYPHNFFLNFWVEIGLVGLLAMLGLLFLFYKKIFSPPPEGKGEMKRGLMLAAAAGMTMILLHGLVDVSYFKNDLSILFWLIYALPNLPLLSSQS